MTKFEIAKEAAGLLLMLLALWVLVLYGSALFADDNLDATWNASTSDVEGTRFHEMSCSVPWTGDLSVSAQCPGMLDSVELVDRPRHPGATACLPEWNETGCYHYDEDGYFTGRTGPVCFATTAYKAGVEDSVFGPIVCHEIALIPEPTVPPLLIEIRLVCDPECTVEIIE